jgi:hypothetical protein
MIDTKPSPGPFDKDFENIRKATCDCMSIGLAIAAYTSRERIALKLEAITKALSDLIECDPDTKSSSEISTEIRRERYAAAREAMTKDIEPPTL